MKGMLYAKVVMSTLYYFVEHDHAWMKSLSIFSNEHKGCLFRTFPVFYKL